MGESKVLLGWTHNSTDKQIYMKARQVLKQAYLHLTMYQSVISTATSYLTHRDIKSLLDNFEMQEKETAGNSFLYMQLKLLG